jgi:small subunit ribosomal protein S1
MSTNVQNDPQDTKVGQDEVQTTPEQHVTVAQETETIDSSKTEVAPDKVTNPTTANETTQNSEQEFSLDMIEQSMNNVSSGSIVDGRVVSVDEKEVLVDIGCKSEATIQLHEFTPENIPQKGDIIKVFVVTRESGDGKPILSKKRADFISNYTKMREIFLNNETITGKLTRRVKGGMIAEIMGVEAFLPGSQIALKNVPNLDPFINKEVTLKIIKLDEERKNIIVSRRKVLESEMESKKEKLKDFIKIDAELDGEVKNITEYGAFIDLGGIDGLLYITDMSWGRINHPADMLNIGDKIKVKVIGFDEKNSRVSLGIKQLVPHPWENIESKYIEGTKVTGKIVNITKYGAFVELEPGVEGLIHVSEMSWTKKIANPRQILREGDTVSAIVLVVSKENQRISLGMKQMQPNPWLTIEERYPVGTVLTRKVKNLTTFGAFVEIEVDIDGLIHISDISWTKRIYHPKEILKKGQEVEAVILSVDKLLKRVALGMKQLYSDPWLDIQENLPVNTEVVGRISKCIPKGILVDIQYGDSLVEGFVPISHLALVQVDRTEDAFEVGEELAMKIIEIDLDNRRLILSVKAWYFSREKSLLKEYQKAHSDKITTNKKKRKSTEPEPVDETVKDLNYGYDDEKYKNDDDYVEHEVEHPNEVPEAPDDAETSEESTQD